MTTSGQRQERILELCRRHGFVAVEDLARRFAVTPQTIRRDINLLCEQMLLRRLVPMIPVILVVLAFSFVGDALRDALDPYS